MSKGPCRALLLAACERVDETNLVNQKNLFLQSILQVEEAGRMLQSNQLTQQQIDQALPGFTENTLAVWMVCFKDRVLADYGGESMTIRYQ